MISNAVTIVWEIGTWLAARKGRLFGTPPYWFYPVHRGFVPELDPSLSSLWQYFVFLFPFSILRVPANVQ